MLVIAAIVGGFFVLLLILVMVAERNRVHGTCPHCSAKISLMYGIGACHNCGAGLRFSSDKQYVPLEAGFVPPNPTFITNLAKLKKPSQWQVIWPGRCCVCGQSATAKKKVKIKYIVGQMGALLTPTNLTDDTNYEVGYCKEHSDGMRFVFPPGVANAKRNEHCTLIIRSYDYYREFMHKNSQHGFPTAGRKVA
jgi:hypothetical protein